MNIVNKLTLKHMKMNRKRTLVTIMGVIISVAMITAVSVLAFSFLNLMKEDCIARDGLWHVEYDNVNAEQLAALNEDQASRSVAVKRPVGYAVIDEPRSMYRPYLYVQEFNEAAMTNFPVELLEGRLPETDSELAVTSEMLEQESLGFALGDTVTLSMNERWLRATEEDGVESQEIELGDNMSLSVNPDGTTAEFMKPLGDKAYTIVGVIETPPFHYSSYASHFCMSGFNPSSLTEGGSSEQGEVIGKTTVKAFVVLAKPDGSLFDHAKALAAENGISDVKYNNDLLRYMGIIRDDGVRAMLFSLSAVIMGIIIVGSVSLIYNAFAISVSERFRHLGMLSSVGATARQKKNSVFFEGAVIGLISIPIGIVCGLLGIGITFHFVNPVLQELMATEMGLKLVIRPAVLIAAVLLSALTIFISVYVPARRASKVSPIDAIRQTTDIRLSEKSVRTSRLTARLFGVEGNVALKNLKRNRRRYKATVFSLIISLVLFLTVSYFGESLQSSYQKTLNGIDYDTTVNVNCWDTENPEKSAQAVMNARYADTAVEVISMSYYMPEDSPYERTRVVALDDKSLQDYAKKTGISAEALLDPAQNAAIVVDTITYKDEETGKYVTKQIIDGKRGEKWKLYGAYPADGEESRAIAAFGEVSMEGFTDILPSGVSTEYSPDDAVMIVSKATSSRLLEELGEDNGSALDKAYKIYMTSSEPDKLQEELEMLNDPLLYIFSISEMHRQEEQMLFLMSVFVFGFITLITLICVANIFNTISTSITLRRREFAMLRSVGMTPEGFNRMIRYESIFYGLKALLYGLPISVLMMALLYRSYMNSFDFEFILPWKSIVIGVLAVFAIVFVTMLYSSSKVKKENIIECLRQESI